MIKIKKTSTTQENLFLKINQILSVTQDKTCHYLQGLISLSAFNIYFIFG
jgi:hypothetical protein